MSEKKRAISLRIDPSVLEWFKQQQPSGYQTLMHSVLQDHVSRNTERSIWLAGRAQEIFNRYYSRCFWHYKRDLKIGPDNIKLVIDGLKKYGGREGLLLAEELCR